MKQLFKRLPRNKHSRAQGQYWEQQAAKYLQQQGLRIVECNYHSRYGEIDLIAIDNEQYVFIEVRARKDLRFGRPSETVSANKQAKIMKTAQAYLQQHKLDVSCRFDVVEVVLSADTGKASCHWIPQAFDGHGEYA